LKIEADEREDFLTAGRSGEHPKVQRFRNITLICLS
jgi:hypothetical protein